MPVKDALEVQIKGKVWKTHNVRIITNGIWLYLPDGMKGVMIDI